MFFDTKPQWQSTFHYELYFVYPCFFLFFLWMLPGLSWPSLWFERHWLLCKVIIFSQICLDWRVLCMNWSLVFFRDPGRGSDLLSVPRRSMLESGNTLQSPRGPTHHENLLNIDNRSKAVSLQTKPSGKCSICIRITDSLKYLFIRQTFFLSFAHLCNCCVWTVFLTFFFLT